MRSLAVSFLLLSSAAGAAAPPAPFAMCSACHAVTPETAGVGPTLWGIGGRLSGAQPGYQYSDALKKAKIKWTSQSLAAFIKAPQVAVPGNKMPFGGIKDPQQVNAIVSYLMTLK